MGNGKPYPEWTDKQVSELRKRVRAGATWRELARDFPAGPNELSERGIRDRLSLLGMKLIKQNSQHHGTSRLTIGKDHELAQRERDRVKLRSAEG